MNRILASLTVLPKLVNGKVCVINPNGSYSLYNPSRYTTITDHFNPMDYSVLVQEPYAQCIVYSKSYERTNYLVNAQLKAMGSPHRSFVIKQYGKGDKIHIHSRRGVYEVVAHDSHTITITCNKWLYERDPKDRVRLLPVSDFKCIAGGLHNYSE